MNPTWPTGVAHRIGLRGAIAFTPARVGLTLHVPCERGKHTVDFDVKPNLHPDHVAKLMLAKGWSFGTKLACPECSRAKKHRKEEIPNMATKADETADETPSAAAAKAHRLVMMLLEEEFDEAKGSYKNGYTDARIAKETGAAEAHVRQTRDKYFAPLRQPSEIEDLRAELDRISSAAVAEAKRIQSEAAQALSATEKKIEVVRDKIATLCRNNGWTTPA